jgi:hypothetical protein
MHALAIFSPPLRNRCACRRQHPAGSDTGDGATNKSSIKEAKRRARKAFVKLAKIGEQQLAREGQVRREVGPDGVVRFQAIVPKH